MNPKSEARMINLGCGNRFHSDWVNADIAPSDPSVIPCDLSKNLPFPDNGFDVVYHSNVLEHIRRDDALPFLRECYRILKPGGILRVATPDLERICKLYLEKLQRAAAGDSASAYDYDWMLLEMYDQTVREKSGGGMIDFLRKNPLPNEPFVLERIGQEGRELITTLRRASPSKQPAPKPRTPLQEIVRRPRSIFKILGQIFLKSWFGPDAQRALEIGRFRLAGEVHQWMYDRFSLARLMMSAGFRDPILRSPVDSAIPNWSEFHLDTLPDGSAIKPDSFFMEARKPG
jgi:SAM-dependent methyltransferase